MNIYTKHIFLYCLMLCTALFTACSDDDDIQEALAEGQGEVILTFDRNQVYSITSLEEMVRLKVTLEKDGETITLPTFDLTGDEKAMTSEPIRLDNGVYTVKKYIAYNNKGVQVMEAYLESDNELVVEHESVTTFYFPISIRITYSNNMLRSTLFGICTEIFGNDSTLWPKTWREENEDFLTWENLHFETDDYGNIAYLSEIVFDEKFAANTEKGFEGMKKLPSAVAEMPTIESLVIRNIPEFEELPDNLNKSGISSITVLNTSLKEFPKHFENIKHLNTLSIINSKLTEIPASLQKLENLFAVNLDGNEITSFPAELAKSWQKLVSLSMRNTKLQSLPAEIFSMKKVSTFDFRNNPDLSSLPETRGEGVALAGFLLDGCGFTSIPAIAATEGIRMLSLADNKITSVSNNELSTTLQCLILDGNPLSAAPVINHEKLMELSLDNCGLTEIPDVSGLPNLRSLYVAKNHIQEVKADAFTKCKMFSTLGLEGNNELQSIDNNAFYTTTDYKLEESTNTSIARPIYMVCVDVDNCPNLTWAIPDSWNHIPTIDVTNKVGLKFGDSHVVVYHKNSNGVTRTQHCKEPLKNGKECGKNHDARPVKDFEEWKEQNLK